MTELKIPEVILRERQKKKLTQEQLAAALGVSPQAISNWERGGYPDITLLPVIANFFEITVDELIGNDEVTREADIKAFEDKFWHISSTKEGQKERLTLAKKYYRKYPTNYGVMHALGFAIVNNMDTLEENIALLSEIHEKILAGCTTEFYRTDSLYRMCLVCPDEDLEKNIGKSNLDWGMNALDIGVLKEERCWMRGLFKEYRAEEEKTNLLVLMHYLGKNNMRYYEHDNDGLFEDPEYTAAWEAHKLTLLEGMDKDGVPEAFLGCYAEFTLKFAGATIGAGHLDEGFEALDLAFSRYEKWLSIPEHTKLSFGSGFYRNARIEKDTANYNCNIEFDDGSRKWTPSLWLFWQLKGDIKCAMMQWRWFNAVREDPRYTAALARAEEMAK